jgi:hypothetical protein
MQMHQKRQSETRMRQTEMQLCQTLTQPQLCQTLTQPQLIQNRWKVCAKLKPCPTRLQ